MSLDIDAIVNLYARRGHRRYGEGVSQLDHALQCARLAAAGGAAPALVAAALLHDIGHLLDAPDEADSDADHRHEAAGAAVLAPLFGPAVAMPVALHVAAKRYLCASEPGYQAALSPASQRSLVRQGGAFDRTAGATFAANPFAAAAITLRRCDDGGKVVADATARTFSDYLPLLAAATLPSRR